MGTTHTLAFLRTLWPFNNLRMPEYYDVLARSHRSLVRYSFFFYFVLKLLSTNFIFNVWLVNTKLLIFFSNLFFFFLPQEVIALDVPSELGWCVCALEIRILNISIRLWNWNSLTYFFQVPHKCCSLPLSSRGIL